MPNFSYLSTHPEYSLFANSAIEAEKVFSTSPAMCGGVPEGVGAGGEVGVCGRQDHHDALQGQPAIPPARAELPVRGGPQCVERAAQHREGGQSGGTYGA